MVFFLSYPVRGGVYILLFHVCIGWIGTGVMGKSMVGHLMNAGYTATVYNRTKRYVR